MEYSEHDRWQWADRVAEAAPPWTDERWHRANATLGITTKPRPEPRPAEWADAA